MRRALPIPLLAAAALLPGCLERRVSITSEPPGALVTANEVELGRTPLEASFTFYGEYDVRVEKEGFEVLRTKAKANTPIYENPPLDLLATAVPFTIETTVRWHFKLQPELVTVQSKEELERGMLERAAALRSQINK